MVCTLLVMFMDSGQTARPEKCLLQKGFQHDFAAGDSFVLTGPIRDKPALNGWSFFTVMSNLRKRWLDLGLGEVFGENAHSLGFIEAQVGKPRQNIVYVSGE